MKRLLYTFVALAFVIALRTPASEAIPFYGNIPNGSNIYSGNIVGYANGGAGFAFSPLTDISVYSLGFNNPTLASNDFRVTLLDILGNQLASVIINTNDLVFNQTRYETFTPLTLSAGNTYYLSAADLGGTWFGDVIVASGDLLNGSFSVAPEISYLGYALGTNASGVFPNAVYTDPLAYFVGANFQFSPSSIVPEPTVFCLGVLGFGALTLTRRRAARR